MKRSVFVQAYSFFSSSLTHSPFLFYALFPFFSLFTLFLNIPCSRTHYFSHFSFRTLKTTHILKRYKRNFYWIVYSWFCVWCVFGYWTVDTLSSIHSAPFYTNSIEYSIEWTTGPFKLQSDCMKSNELTNTNMHKRSFASIFHWLWAITIRVLSSVQNLRIWHSCLAKVNIITIFTQFNAMCTLYANINEHPFYPVCWVSLQFLDGFCAFDHNYSTSFNLHC